jgi:putative tatD-related DNAse protein
MELLDIHTHHLAESTFSAIKNIRFLKEEFSPEPGRYYSIGIHPWDVELEDEIDWGLFEELAMHPQVLAVGECGIDKLVHKELLPAQERIFLRQLGIAERLLKPVLIHNVKSTEIISLMKGRSPGLVPWILHGFRGKEPLALQLIRHGFYLSFGARYNEDTLRAVPLDRLFLETDDAETDIHEIYKKVADTLNMSVGELTERVQRNIKNVFFNE